MALTRITDSSTIVATAVNNGGTMVANGTSAALNSIGTSTTKVGVFGSTPVQNDDVRLAISGGEFAHNHTLPITKRVTTELGGVDTDVLATTAGQPQLIRSINKVENITTTKFTSAIREGKYNIYTNVWESGYPVTVTETFATDTAANPTREVPGSLTFMYGGPVASGTDYSPKTT